MRITSIERQKRRRGRVSIFVDDEFAIGISEETLLKEGLRKGDTITSERLAQIRTEESYTQTRLSALRLLAVRPRSVHEITGRLRKKEYQEADISKVIADLQRTGMLDDSRFAQMVVSDHLASNPAGPRFIAARLRKFGIDRQTAETAIEAGYQGSDEERCAREAAEKYMRTRARGANDTTVLRNRLGAFLSRRGFSWDVIRSVTATILPEREE